MTKPLPGLGAPLPTPQQHQDLANETQFTIFTAACMIHAREAIAAGTQAGGHFDGYAIVQGCIGGAIQFAFLGEVAPEVLREKLVETLDALIPQLYMHKLTGGTPVGQA